MGNWAARVRFAGLDSICTELPIAIFPLLAPWHAVAHLLAGLQFSQA